LGKREKEKHLVNKETNQTLGDKREKDKN
jgi:hypothetical protein